MFAGELWNRLPRQQSAGEKRREENRKREKEAIDMFNKNSKFGLVESDDDELSIKPSKKKKKKKEKAAAKEDSDEDEFERMEKERQNDLKERDAFHQRMVNKDKDKQRNIATKSEKKGFEEAAKRSSIEDVELAEREARNALQPLEAAAERPAR